MSKILVTGATGTIGRPLTLALAQAGVDVRAGARDPSRAADLAQAGAELIRLDWSDPASVTAAFADVDRLFLLTPFVEDPSVMVQAALSAARDAGVSHVVRLSSMGADAGSDFTLAREHGRNESLVKNSGIAWTVLRPTFFMDNILSYSAQTISAEGRLYAASGQGRASYISAVDIAATAAAILRDPAEHAGKTYELTGGQAHADAEIASLLTELRGATVTYVGLTPEQQRAGLEQQGTPGWMVDALLGLEDVKRSGWAEAVSPAVEQLTGRPPEALRSFLQRNIAAFG